MPRNMADLPLNWMSPLVAEKYNEIVKIWNMGREEMKYIYEQLNYKEHISCPNCQKLMVKRVSTEIDSVIDGMPAKEWTYWCNCGNIQTGGILKGIPELQWCKEEWKRVNNIRRSE